MSTPSKRRREVRAKLFGPDGKVRHGFSLTAVCPKKECGHAFMLSTGTLDPEEGKCSHRIWKNDPWRGVQGGITCTNCGLFLTEDALQRAFSTRTE